jgi:hypothetical protein
MAEKREKTVSYRRAVWVKGAHSINLEMCITEALNKCTSLSDRTVARGNGQLVRLAAAPEDGEGGRYLHLVVDTPGEAASVVPTNSRAAELKVGTTPPPANMDFMDADAFAYVRGNHVCLCTTSMTDSTTRQFLADLFVRAKLRKDASEFDLLKVGDQSKLKIIQDEGVKEIDIKGTIYEATAHYNKRKGQAASLLGHLGKEVRAILGSANDVNDDALDVGLTLKIDHRRKKGISLGEKRLKSIAESLVENLEKGDDFSIITNNDRKITPDELFMKTIVEI